MSIRIESEAMKNTAEHACNTASRPMIKSLLSKFIKSTVLVATLFLMFVASTACSNNSNTLNGSYVREAEGYSTTVYTFSKNGHITLEMTVIAEGAPVIGNAKGTYAITGDTIELTWTEVPENDLFRFTDGTRSYDSKGKLIFINGYEFRKE